MRVAVIGTGISGSLAARLLATRHEVTVYEAESRPGGHACTVDVELDGQPFAVDVGFMVFNRRTYPNFCRLLEWLEVASQPADMSFSVRCERSGLEYQGSSLNGLFAQRRNLLRPAWYRMLADIVRFNRNGLQAVAQGDLSDGLSVDEYIRRLGTGREFVEHYLVPLSAAIWSADPAAIMQFPARFLIGFLANHGLLQLRNRPQWRTIVGGSRNCLRPLLEPLEGQIRYGCPVEKVWRTEAGVTIDSGDGNREQFDNVVFATHADQTLKMLADPSAPERNLLAAFPFQSNVAVLHTDVRALPRLERARASWNYCIPRDKRGSAAVTYDLVRLQSLPCRTPVLLTINDVAGIDERKILRTFHFRHPAFTRESMAAQQELRETSGRHHTWFCGAWNGFGFHEDGVNSALAVAAGFDIRLDSCTAAFTKDWSRTTVGSR